VNPKARTTPCLSEKGDISLPPISSAPPAGLAAMADLGAHFHGLQFARVFLDVREKRVTFITPLKCNESRRHVLRGERTPASTLLFDVLSITSSLTCLLNFARAFFPE
jgi:hypothetical protein